MRTALIVVDMQNDFMDDGALPVEGAYSIVEAVNDRIILGMSDRHYDLIVASQDWHPADHGSFASNHEGHDTGEVIKLDGLDQILWPDHCVENTEGAEFVEGIDRDHFHQVFQKGTDPLVDSYSAFYDNDHRVDSGLADYLRSYEIEAVHVCGLALDYCVKFTVLDACAEGFDTTLLYDLTKGVGLGEHDIEIALKQMLEAGATISPSQS